MAKIVKVVTPELIAAFPELTTNGFKEGDSLSFEVVFYETPQDAAAKVDVNIASEPADEIDGDAGDSDYGGTRPPGGRP